MFRWGPAVVVGWLVFAPGTASAFCRTTTVKPPASYDPRVRGCWTEGVPLHWSIDRAPYGIAARASKRVSLQDAMRSVDSAFRAWNEALCDTGPLGIQAYDDGPITSVPDGSHLTSAGSDASTLARWADCTDSNACDPKSHDVVVFDDDSWPYDDTANTLALTTVTFGKDDGRIFEAYTEVDSHEHELTATQPPATNNNAFDLQAIMTHEAGHFFGLAHSADAHAVMNATYAAGKIGLAPDDVTAICAAYANTPRVAGSCAAAQEKSHPSEAPAAAVVALAAVLLRWRRRAQLQEYFAAGK